MDCTLQFISSPPEGEAGKNCHSKTRESFKLKERSQLFISTNNKPHSIVAVRICNKNCLPAGINR